MIDDCKTLPVPEAGRRYFGLSRAGSYMAAARGDLPTIRIGRKLCVPVIALEKMLEQAKPRNNTGEARVTSERPKGCETLFARAVAALDEQGGRYAALGKPAVTGAAPLPLAAPQWAKDAAALPSEAALDFDVNSVPDMTTLDGLPREGGK